MYQDEEGIAAGVDFMEAIGVAISESDGLIAVISEKYMNSTYCNDGMHACTQRYTTHRRSCLQRWSWQRAQDCSFSQFCFEVRSWHLVQTHSSFVVSVFFLALLLPLETVFESLPEGKLAFIFRFEAFIFLCIRL